MNDICTVDIRMRIFKYSALNVVILFSSLVFDKFSGPQLASWDIKHKAEISRANLKIPSADLNYA